MDEKIYTLIAGINGAGKSTFYKENLLSNENIINPDEILLNMGGDWRNTQDQFKAGKIAVKQIKDCMEQGVSFFQETTLGGKSTLRTIDLAKSKSYKINMFYVSVDSSEIAKTRVHNRVINGGHGIDENLIEKRFITSLETLEEAIPKCDKVWLYDNTEKFKQIAFIKNNVIMYLKSNLSISWHKDILSTINKNKVLPKNHELINKFHYNSMEDDFEL